jgi:hypothetical protein
MYWVWVCANLREQNRKSRVREVITPGPQLLPNMIIHGVFKNSVAPTAREGFSQVDTDACASPLEAFLMPCHHLE